MWRKQILCASHTKRVNATPIRKSSPCGQVCSTSLTISSLAAVSAPPASLHLPFKNIPILTQRKICFVSSGSFTSSGVFCQAADKILQPLTDWMKRSPRYSGGEKARERLSAAPRQLSSKPLRVYKGSFKHKRQHDPCEHSSSTKAALFKAFKGLPRFI